MKTYIVWYRLFGDEEDKVRGVARNWVRAEAMAQTLDLHLRSSGKKVEVVGVKSALHGEIYQNQEFHMRWKVDSNQ